MKKLTQTEVDSLTKMIYDSLMNNPDFGLGEMGEIRDEAERIVRDWAAENNIEMPDETDIFLPK